MIIAPHNQTVDAPEMLRQINALQLAGHEKTAEVFLALYHRTFGHHTRMLAFATSVAGSDTVAASRPEQNTGHTLTGEHRRNSATQRGDVASPSPRSGAL